MAKQSDAEVLDELIVGKRPDFSRRVCFLDFDGVLNLGLDESVAWGDTRELVCATVDITDAQAREKGEKILCQISYFKEVADILREMNCVWLTSWKGFTQTALNPMLGFDFGYVDWKYRGFCDPGRYGKMNSVGKIVRATGCEWVVCDDDMRAKAVKEWIELDSKKSGEIIAPDHWKGLTQDDLAHLQELMAE